MLGRFSLLILILIPGVAYAMPDVVTVAGAVLIQGGNPWFMALGYILVVVGTIWGGEEAKRAAKEKEDAAKRAYNNSLKDRSATVISSEQPHRYIYGRARVGSAIIAVLASGSRDEYKHLVCIHAAHECDAIEEMYINGKALGTLDGNGYVTSGDYYTNSSAQKQDDFTGTGTTLSYTPISGTLRIKDAYSETEYLSYTLIGNVISGLSYNTYRAYYSYNNSYGNLRVLKHLGSTTQLADTTLISEVPAYWDTTKKLSGFCYTVITLNLNFADFQSGAPTVEALIRGKKLHDVRSVYYPSDIPVWSQNNALMIADYLTSEMCGVPLPIVDHYTGTAQAGSATTLTLQSGANETDDYYKERYIRIISGTGINQFRRINSSRKNLLTYSQKYNSGWTLTRGTLSTGITDPFGGSNAWYLDETTVAGSTYFYKSAFPLVSGNIYTASFYAKKAEDVTVFCWMASTFFTVPTVRQVSYNFDTGILSDTNNNLQGKSVTILSNGWYRISMTFLVDITITGSALVTGSLADTNTTASGVYLFGHQLEIGLAATDYIRTEASSAIGVSVDAWDVIPDSSSTYDAFIVTGGDLPLADYIAAANVCDESTAYGARYEANGTVDADQSQSQVIEKMAQSMAGTVCATTWGCKAGAYVAPVMSLSQSDIVGDMSYTAGTAEADLYNGVKGQYISADNLYVPTDFQPYQNLNYVTADGSELWTDVSFMFTDTKQRVHNICRVFTEDQRNGFTINAAFSYKTWDLQIGDRVAFTSEFMGQTAKIYRIIKKNYAPDTAVNITMKEDAASIWDLADAVTEDSTPNTNLPSPFVVQPPSNLAVTEELYQTTGSAGIKTKAIFTWNNITSGILEYEFTYKSYYETFYTIKINSVSESIDVFDIADGRYDCKVRARNYLNIWSEYSTPLYFEIFGLNVLPSDVTGFTVKPFNGLALCNWDRTTDLDVKIGGDVVIRFCPLTTGATFAQSVILPDGEYNGDATSASVSLATGTYYIQFKDSTGHFSLTPASFVATESLVTGWTTVATSTQHTAFTGVKTDCVAIDNILKLGGSTLFDDFGLIDDIIYIDSVGNVSNLGIYLFNATMDLSTSSTRRFHSHIKSLVYSDLDNIDDRIDFIDLWGDFDGSTINGVTATTYASISDDDIIYSNWMPFMVADFNCRYAKFKLELTTNDATHNIDVSELEVKAKVLT